MKKLIISTAFLALGLNMNTALADTETGTAKVFIQETIQVTENTQVDFGSIPSTDGVCTMSSAGALSGTCSGSGTTGSFGVTGSANQSVAVSTSAGAAVDGVTFNPVLITPASTTLDGTGAATVDVTGSLTLSGATSGQKSINYTVTVNYN